MFLKNVISAEPINKGRQPELDMAKAVIAFFLAFIHCTIECTSENNLAYGIPYAFDTVIGGPLSAPMFMFAMGVGMIYTKHNTAGDFAKRGLKLWITGFVLNLCRYTLPFLLGYLITSDYNQFIAPLLYRTFCIDMLQFAGLAMMAMAVLGHFKISDAWMFLISFVMSIAGMFLNGADVGTPWENILLGFLIGTEDAAGMVFTDFPLLNWLIVPVSGYIFGKYLIRVKNKDKFYLLLSPACFLLTVVYFIIGIKTRAGMFGEGQNCYYHITTNDVLITITAVIGILGVYYQLSKQIPKKWMYWIGDISKNVTVIYCIHWVIITLIINVGFYAVRGTQELSVTATMLLSFGISITAIILAHVWRNRSKYRRISKG